MPSVPNFKHIGHFPICDLDSLTPGVNVFDEIKGGFTVEEAKKEFWDLYEIFGNIDITFTYSDAHEVFVSDTFDTLGDPTQRVCDADLVHTVSVSDSSDPGIASPPGGSGTFVGEVEDGTWANPDAYDYVLSATIIVGLDSTKSSSDPDKYAILLEISGEYLDYRAPEYQWDGTEWQRINEAINAEAIAVDFNGSGLSLTLDSTSFDFASATPNGEITSIAGIAEYYSYT